MATLKNRLVVEVAKNLNALFHLELGLTRGPVPDFERSLGQTQKQLDQTRKQLSNKDRELQLLRQEVNKRTAQLSGVRGELSENRKLLSRDRKLLLESNRRLSKSQEQLENANSDARSKQSQVEQSTKLTDEPFDTALYSDIAKLLENIPIDLGGGCSVSKAYVLASLIRDHDLKVTAEIGVYRGRSLFPQALAHSKFTGGLVYGIDPWSTEEAREEHTEFADSELKQELNHFIEKTDWQGIYEEVESLNESLGYEDHCVLLRQTSTDAISHFEENDITLDLVHIDGNHDTGKVAEDVALYEKRLRSGGFIVLDDISFKSVKPMYEELVSRTQLVFERTDDNHANDYAVFQNIPPSQDAKYNRKSWVQEL